MQRSSNRQVEKFPLHLGLRRRRVILRSDGVCVHRTAHGVAVRQIKPDRIFDCRLPDEIGYLLGIYNDGYLGSDTDLGTFTDRKKEVAFLGEKVTDGKSCLTTFLTLVNRKSTSTSMNWRYPTEPADYYKGKRGGSGGRHFGGDICQLRRGKSGRINA